MFKKIYQFTTGYNGLASALITEVEIGSAFDMKSGEKLPALKKYNCVWDTGATGSVITTKVVNECGLKVTGSREVGGIHGVKEVNTYLISMRLPNGVGFPLINVIEASSVIGKNIDVLIGMNIITQGDFAVTNKDGKTVLSFRYPSMERIDFVKQKPKGIREPARNAPCPCGSGKKYKFCCGTI